MEEIDSTDSEKTIGVDPKEVKGINTSTGSTYSEESDDLGNIKESDFYTPDQSGISKIAGTGVDIGASTNNFSVNAAAAAQFTAVDIAKGIRDPNERAAYIKEHGSKMTPLIDGVVGIKFDYEIEDYAKFRHKQYDTKVAKLLDDLDENQGFVKELGNFTGKLLGRTVTAVSGIIPVVYGMGEAIMTGDGKRLFDNTMFDQWEKADKALDEYFVVYGGDSYTSGEEKNVFMRFADNPMKSLTDDFAPTIAFVAGAVGTSYITGGVGAFQATKGVSYVNGLAKVGAKTNLVFKNGVKWARGIKNFEDVAQYGSFVQKYSKGIGTINQMVLSAGYESALIARDTQSTTALNSKISYIKDNPKLAAEYDALVREHIDEFGNMDKTQEELVEELSKKFPTSVARKIQYAADQAGNLAFFTNVPLVGASNLIQFSKAFNSSYKAGQSLIAKNSLNPLKGAVRNAEKELVTAASQATRGQKILGYTGVVLKPGLTESFEEFSQGVIEKGYSDYYALEYKDGAILDTKSFLDSMATQASLYANSVEGFDSVALGFLMGMVGLPLGISQDSKTGKTKIGFGFTGGIKESLQEFKEELRRTDVAVEHYNEGNFNEVLKNNLTASIKQIQIQKDLDKYAEEENIFDYKNAEFQSIYNFIENRIKNEIGETVFQDIDALEKMSLEEFNEQFAFKEDSFQFTKETKKQAIKSMRNTAESIVKAHEEVNTVLSYKRGFIDRLFKTKFEGISNEDQFFTESLTDQMKFLYASGLNLKKREEELTQRMNDLTKGKLNVSELGIKSRSKLASNKDGDRKKEEDTAGLLSQELAGIDPKTGKAVFADQVAELKKMIKDQIKFDRETEIAYNKNSVEIDQIVEDVVKLRDMESKTWELYKTLFTPKGAKKFAEIKAQLVLFKAVKIEEANAEQQKEELAKKRSSEGASKVATNAVSTNNEFIVKEQLQQDLQKIDKTYQEEKQKLLKNENPTDEDTANFAIKVLENMSPLLFAKIKEIANNSEEYTSIFSDEVIDVIQGNADPDSVSKDRTTTFKILNRLIKENKEANNKPIVTLDYANEEDNKPFVNSVTPTLGSTKENHDTNTHLSLKERLAKRLEEQQGKNYVEKGTTSSDKTIILRYSDKIGKTGLIPDGNGGYIAVNKDMPITETSNKKVNDGTFLSNEELKNNNVRATFKLVEDSPFIKKLKEENDYNETTAPINVYYGDTFIGRLPGSSETSTPQQLRNLRKALFKQLTADEAVSQEAPGVYTGYKSTAVPTALETLEQQLEAEESLEFSSEEVIKDLKQQIKNLTKTETKETTTQDIETKKTGFTEKEARSIVNQWKTNAKDLRGRKPSNAQLNDLDKAAEALFKKLLSLKAEENTEAPTKATLITDLFDRTKDKQIDLSEDSPVSDLLNIAVEFFKNTKSTPPERAKETTTPEKESIEEKRKASSKQATNNAQIAFDSKVIDEYSKVTTGFKEDSEEKFPPRTLEEALKELESFLEQTFKWKDVQVTHEVKTIKEEGTENIKSIETTIDEFTIQLNDTNTIGEVTFVVRGTIGTSGLGTTTFLLPLNEINDAKYNQEELELQEQEIVLLQLENTELAEIEVYDNKKATKAEEEANKKTIINFLNSKKSFEELSEEEKNKLAIVWQFQFVKASETEPLNMSKDLKDLINSDEVNRPDLTKLEDEKDVLDLLMQIVNPIEQFVDNKISEFIKNNLDSIKQSERYYERFKRVGKEEYDEISEQSSIFDIKNVFSDPQVLQLLSENKIDFGKTKEVTPETEVEQTAREKVIGENFKSIIKALTANPIMQGDEFIGEKKC